MNCHGFRPACFRRFLTAASEMNTPPGSLRNEKQTGGRATRGTQGFQRHVKLEQKNVIVRDLFPFIRNSIKQGVQLMVLQKLFGTQLRAGL